MKIRTLQETSAIILKKKSSGTHRVTHNSVGEGGGQFLCQEQYKIC
jgi:hypothetical protein